jgi:hypothetical protein
MTADTPQAAPRTARDEFAALARHHHAIGEPTWHGGGGLRFEECQNDWCRDARHAIKAEAASLVSAPLTDLREAALAVSDHHNSIEGHHPNDDCWPRFHAALYVESIASDHGLPSSRVTKR